MSQPLKLLPPAPKTDQGRARANNEDWVDYEIPTDPDRLAEKGILFVVADGAGGHERGQEASRTAVNTAISTYYGEASQDVEASLVHAFKVANAEVFRLSAGAPGDKNAMTTLVAAVIRDDELYVAHVGDSRAYLVRGNAIRPLTEDHSWVEEQVRAGVLSEEEARKHPQRSLITRAIGADRDVQVDTTHLTMKPGDAVVLCTDGLTNQMSDDEIREHVTSQPPKEAAQRMIDEVNGRGGYDNITALVVKSQQPQAVPAGRSLSVSAVLGLAALLLFAGLSVFGAWRFMNDRPSDNALGAMARTAGTEPPSVTSPVPPQPTSTAPPDQVAVEPPPTASDSTRVPTATLRVTRTATPTATATLTPVTRTPAATLVQSSPTTATLYPAPTLIAPGMNASLIGPATFTWNWNRTIGPSEFFALRVWRLEKEPFVDKVYDTKYRFQKPPNGNGEYEWQVVVLREREDGRIIPISEEPDPIRLDFWREPQDGGSTKPTARPSPVYTKPPTE